MVQNYQLLFALISSLTIALPQASFGNHSRYLLLLSPDKSEQVDTKEVTRKSQERKDIQHFSFMCLD